MANRTARGRLVGLTGSVGQWRAPLAGGGPGEADAVAGGVAVAGRTGHDHRSTFLVSEVRDRLRPRTCGLRIAGIILGMSSMVRALPGRRVVRPGLRHAWSRAAVRSLRAVHRRTAGSRQRPEAARRRCPRSPSPHHGGARRGSRPVTATTIASSCDAARDRQQERPGPSSLEPRRFARPVGPVELRTMGVGGEHALTVAGDPERDLDGIEVRHRHLDHLAFGALDHGPGPPQVR